MKNLKLASLLFLALSLFAAAGCRIAKSSKQAQVPAGQKVQLLVFVPCGIEGPFNEIAAAFMKAHPEVDVLPRTENIDVLVQRVLSGDEADVFLSLGDIEIKQMKEAGRLLEDTIKPFAGNYLAVIVAKDNPGKINTIQDFANKDSGFLCFADPEKNSVGYYARLALQNAGVWDKVKDRLILPAQPARVKVFLGEGRASTAIMYAPCLQETRQPEKKTFNFLGAIPQELYPPFPLVAATTTGGQNRQWGSKFISFLLTDQAQTILKHWGFLPLAHEKQTGSKTPILIHSGAGLQPPIDKLGDLFEKKFGVGVEVSYKGSGCLLTDINFSHRGDLYVPGENYYMEQAIQRGFVTKYEVVAYIDAVIIVQKGNPKGISSLEDLARPGLKIGLGNPDAAAIGRISAAVLKKAGILEAVNESVKKAGLSALTVQEMANAVKLEQLDAAIVWKPNAQLVGKDVEIIPIPDQYPKTTEVPLGIVKFSKNPEAAEKFLQFALSSEGQKVFADNGYNPVSPPKEQ